MLLLTGVRAIFFDAVGTLIRPEPPAPRIYEEVGRRYGGRLAAGDISSRFRSAFQCEEKHDYRQALRTSEVREMERWRQIVATVLDDVSDQDACFRELFDHFSRPQAWSCDPEAATTLAELASRGYALGLASNYDGRL